MTRDKRTWWSAGLASAVFSLALASSCLTAQEDAAVDAGGDPPDAMLPSTDLPAPGNGDSGPARGPMDDVRPATGTGGSPGTGGRPPVAGSGGTSGSGGGAVINGTGGAPGTGGRVAAAGPWVPAGAGVVPPIGAFPAGQENNTTFYACRAMYMGGVHGGKAFPKGNCHFGYAGAEITVPIYEVLVGALFSWQAVGERLTAAPLWAMPSGKEASGVAQYVCRAPYQGGLHPGKLLAGQCGIGYGGSEIGLSAFEVLLRPMEGDSGSPFDRSHWKVTASSSDTRYPPSAVLDGNPTTRWSSGRVQTGNEWFRIDLGSTAVIKRLVLDTSLYAGDFPVQYDVAVSADDATYSTFASGSGATITTITTFNPAIGRYLRITQTGRNTGGLWWSIGELDISDQ